MSGGKKEVKLGFIEFYINDAAYAAASPPNSIATH
jgi:hypothetical protein